MVLVVLRLNNHGCNKFPTVCHLGRYSKQSLCLLNLQDSFIHQIGSWGTTVSHSCISINNACGNRVRAASTRGYFVTFTPKYLAQSTGRLKNSFESGRINTHSNHVAIFLHLPLSVIARCEFRFFRSETQMIRTCIRPDFARTVSGSFLCTYLQTPFSKSSITAETDGVSGTAVPNANNGSLEEMLTLEPYKLFDGS